MIWALSIGTWHALWWVALVLIVVAGVGYAAGAAAQEGETRVDPEE
jgi:hypothetical protein